MEISSINFEKSNISTFKTMILCDLTYLNKWNNAWILGLTSEGIYRISGVKSKIQVLKDHYNQGLPVNLHEHEPNNVASLLKQFLRELPEPVLTTDLMPKFEQASSELKLSFWLTIGLYVKSLLKKCIFPIISAL